MRSLAVTLSISIVALLAPGRCFGLEQQPQQLPLPRHENRQPHDQSLENINLPLTGADRVVDSTNSEELVTEPSKPTNKVEPARSFLQDQLESRSPVYLWVPGRGALGVGVGFTW
jgi:hypothetical protein